MSTNSGADAVEFRSDMTVELVKSSASDSDVIWAARVSTKGEASLDDVDGDPERARGLINYLMRDRHGTPFVIWGSSQVSERNEVFPRHLLSFTEATKREPSTCH